MIKEIKTAVLSAFLACSALTTANANENPLSWGIKGFGSNSFLGGVEGVTVNSKNESKKLNLFGGGGLYVKYNFCDYAGVNLDILYTKQGGQLFDEQDQDEKEEKKAVKGTKVDIATHNLSVPVTCYIYPMGIGEDGEDTLNFHLGIHPSFALSKSIKQGTTDLLNDKDDLKNTIPAFHFAGIAGIGYEFGSGLSMEARYSYGFIGGPKVDESKLANYTSGPLTLAKDAKWTNHFMGFTIGYNLAKLISE